MLGKISDLYAKYRRWARTTSYSSPAFMSFLVATSLVASAVIAFLYWTNTIRVVMPWMIMALGLVAGLDALGAAFDRGSKTEGVLRFVLVTTLFGGPGVWLYFFWNH